LPRAPDAGGRSDDEGGDDEEGDGEARSVKAVAFGPDEAEILAIATVAVC